MIMENKLEYINIELQSCIPGNYINIMLATNVTPIHLTQKEKRLWL